MTKGRGVTMEEVMQRDGLYGFEFREQDKRRVPAEERKSPNIKQIWQLSHEIINLASIGYKGTDIAEILNIHPQTVSNTLNSDLGKHKLSKLRQGRDEEVKKTHEKVRVLTNKALQVYHEIFDDEAQDISRHDKMEAAKTVLLELSGLRTPTKIQAQHVHTTLTPEEITELKERGIAAARESGLVIDVPPEPKQLEDGQDISNTEAAGS